jgi:hypothetical protein
MTCTSNTSKFSSVIPDHSVCPPLLQVPAALPFPGAPSTAPPLLVPAQQRGQPSLALLAPQTPTPLLLPPNPLVALPLALHAVPVAVPPLPLAHLHPGPEPALAVSAGARLQGPSACLGQPNLAVGQADTHANLPAGQPNISLFSLIFNTLDKSKSLLGNQF